MKNGNLTHRATKKQRDGFTLLELIVVITIIGIFGTMVAVNIAGTTDKARIAQIRNDIRTIYEAAVAVESQTGNWPETISDIMGAKDPDTGKKISGTLSNYPKDPWGNEYQYELREDGPVVLCLGKDQSESGEGINGDFRWPKEENLY
ncbi:MAG: type II secretion system protein GspG [Planctomycetota bacterium]